MEHQINETPYAINEIPEQLFNSEFLSDITFLIEDNPPIYAHSFELMKRSTVFQEQLQSTYGEKKLIPITGYRYETFHQFIRFIYTDKCDQIADNCMELLKLANKYNVIRLQNFITSKLNFLQLFECHGLPNSDMKSVYIRDRIIYELRQHLSFSSLSSSNEQVLEEILKFDHVNDVNELSMFNALAIWINKQCETNNIPLSDRRQRFDNLIRLIRFPAMTDDELRWTKINYPDLLTRSDYANIFEQKVFEPECKGDIWNAISRKQYESPYESNEMGGLFFYETKFTVSTDMLLRGFVVDCSRIGIPFSAYIKIICHNNVTEEVTSLNFNMLPTAFIHLGRTIRLLPNHTYTIDYKISSSFRNRVLRRLPGHNLIVHDPTNSVKILKTHETMLEIFFEKPS